LDAGARAVFAFGVTQRRATARRQLREVLLEVHRHRSEYRVVSGVLFLPQLRDQRLEVGASAGDVLELLLQVRVAVLELAALRVRQRVGGTDHFEAPLQRAPLALARTAARHLLG